MGVAAMADTEDTNTKRKVTRKISKKIALNDKIDKEVEPC